jgi:hypothetical protein
MAQQQGKICVCVETMKKFEFSWTKVNGVTTDVSPRVIGGKKKQV